MADMKVSKTFARDGVAVQVRSGVPNPVVFSGLSRNSGKQHRMCVSIHGIRLMYDSISAVSIEAESLSLCVEKILRYSWDSSLIGRAR